MNTALASLVIRVIGDHQQMNMTNNPHNQLENAGATVHICAVFGATAGDRVYPSSAR